VGQHLKGFAERLKASYWSLGSSVFVTVRTGLFILASVLRKKKKNEEEKKMRSC